VWKEETGRTLKRLPEGLGKFEAVDENYSIGLALQQIAPNVRSGEPLPEAFVVPFIRGQSPATEATPARDIRKATVAPARFFCPVCRKWGRKGEPIVPCEDRWQHAECL
jgi:hypothetical protein